MIVPLSEAAPLCGGKRFFFAERDTHLIGAIRLRARRAFASRKKICAKRCRLSTRAVVRRGSSPSATVRVCVCRPYGGGARRSLMSSCSIALPTFAPTCAASIARQSGPSLATAQLHVHHLSSHGNDATAETKAIILSLPGTSMKERSSSRNCQFSRQKHPLQTCLDGLRPHSAPSARPQQPLRRRCFAYIRARVMRAASKNTPWLRG